MTVTVFLINLRKRICEALCPELREELDRQRIRTNLMRIQLSDHGMRISLLERGGERQKASE